ncbi:hypothetical protein DPMN_192107 [Dreissena polymorpha]|uniref:Uncharacterized protein n=1 Tax=Dreissena polymorpha TaxID=45954 RepID=A0A9D3XYU3_DREPO|nr:hypothetical protein DPMN_192107 [Dreissena polymorpha]
MRKDMKDLMTSMTATNKQLSDVPSFNLKLISVQYILDDIDSHVKDFAAEVGRRTHLLTRSNQVTIEFCPEDSGGRTVQY